MVDFKPSFEIWLFQDPNLNKFELTLITESLEEACTTYELCAKQGLPVCIFEKGAFMHNGRIHIGNVAFMWNEAMHEYFQQEKVGRAAGLTEFGTSLEYDFLGKEDCLVPFIPGPVVIPESHLRKPMKISRSASSRQSKVAKPVTMKTREVSYSVRRKPPETAQPVGIIDQEVSRPVRVETTKPTYQPPTAHCDDCGNLFSLYLLKLCERKVTIASTSGKVTTGKAASLRLGTKSSSLLFRGFSSKSSGQTFYRHKTVSLCQTCYSKQKSSERGKVIKGVLRWIVS